jgi:hypothetical protein
MREDKPKLNIEFFMPDVTWKDLKLSTKESFLLMVDQALTAKADGIQFSMNADSKGQIALIIHEKTIPILNISPGIFDRYWTFIGMASSAVLGLKVKMKNEDLIYDISCDLQEHQSGRQIQLLFSAPMHESDLIPPDETE